MTDDPFQKGAQAARSDLDEKEREKHASGEKRRTKLAGLMEKSSEVRQRFLNAGFYVRAEEVRYTSGAYRGGSLYFSPKAYGGYNSESPERYLCVDPVTDTEGTYHISFTSESSDFDAFRAFSGARSWGDGYWDKYNWDQVLEALGWWYERTHAVANSNRSSNRQIMKNHAWNERNDVKEEAARQFKNKWGVMPMTAIKWGIALATFVLIAAALGG